MLNSRVLVRGARQLLTLRGPSGPRSGPALKELSIISDGALLIRDGRIEDVGPSRRIENLAIARGALEINAAGRVVMPGFVDSHTYPIFPPQAGMSSMSFRDAIRSGASCIHSTTSRALEAQAAKVTRGMMRHGTTTIEAKSGYGLDHASQMKILRAHAALNLAPLEIVSTFFAASAVPPEYDDAPASWLDYLRTTLLPAIRRRKLARFVDVRCDSNGGFGYAESKRYLEAARVAGFGLKVQTGYAPDSEAVLLACELKAACISVCGRINPDDSALLARAGVLTTVLPDAFSAGGGELDRSVHDLVDRGGAVALASNMNPHTNPGYNMQSVLSLACQRFGFTPAEALSAATINGAHAVGLAREIGSLEAGKSADILFLDVPDYRDIAYSGGVNTVYQILKKGAAIYRQGGILAAEDNHDVDRRMRAEFLRGTGV